MSCKHESSNTCVKDFSLTLTFENIKMLGLLKMVTFLSHWTVWAWIYWICRL